MKWVWVVIPLVLIGIIGMQESFAESEGFSITTDKQIYTFGDEVIINGTVGDAYKNRDDIKITIFGVTMFFIDIDDNREFSHVLQLEGKYRTEKVYVIHAGVNRATTNFYVFDSIPNHSVKINPQLYDAMDLLGYYNKTEQLLDVKLIFDPQKENQYEQIKEFISNKGGIVLGNIYYGTFHAQIPVDLVYDLIEKPEILEIQMSSASQILGLLPAQSTLGKNIHGFGEPDVYDCKENSHSFDLPVSIENGTIHSICGKTQLSITIKFTPTEKGNISIDISKNVLDRMDGDCKNVPFYVSASYREAPSSESITTDGRKVTIPFNEKFSKVVISTRSNPDHRDNLIENCGLQYIPGEMIFYSPLKQIELGNHPKHIVCNYGYNLIFKPISEAPACVKSSSIEKLVERGWTSP